MWAAVVCGDAIEDANPSPIAPEVVSYTTPAGSNQVLFVGVVIRSGAANILSATHAGNSMTAIAAEAFLDPIGTRMFYIVSPTSGTNDVSVDLNGVPLEDAIVVFTCSGVNTVAPVHDANTATGNNTAPTVTVANVIAGDVVVDMMGTDIAASDPTVGANQTAFHTGFILDDIGYGSSQQAGADGGVMSWTTALTQQWAIHAVAVSPAASTGQPVSLIMLGE